MYHSIINILNILYGVIDQHKTKLKHYIFPPPMIKYSVNYTFSPIIIIDNIIYNHF